MWSRNTILKNSKFNLPAPASCREHRPWRWYCRLHPPLLRWFRFPSPATSSSGPSSWSTWRRWRCSPRRTPQTSPTCGWRTTVHCVPEKFDQEEILFWINSCFLLSLKLKIFRRWLWIYFFECEIKKKNYIPSRHLTITTAKYIYFFSYNDNFFEFCYNLLSCQLTLK